MSIHVALRWSVAMEVRPDCILEPLFSNFSDTSALPFVCSNGSGMSWDYAYRVAGTLEGGKKMGREVMKRSKGVRSGL